MTHLEKNDPIISRINDMLHRSKDFIIKGGVWQFMQSHASRDDYTEENFEKMSETSLTVGFLQGRFAGNVIPAGNSSNEIKVSTTSTFSRIFGCNMYDSSK